MKHQAWDNGAIVDAFADVLGDGVREFITSKTTKTLCGKRSEGYPEYSGIINLGNASEPFDSQNLEVFQVSADLFRLDPIVARVIENNSRIEASEDLQTLAQRLINDDSVDVEGYQKVWHVIEYLRQESN